MVSSMQLTLTGPNHLGLWLIFSRYNYFTMFAEIYELTKELELKSMAKQVLALFQIMSAFGPTL